jgi:hypothetical protein
MKLDKLKYVLSPIIALVFEDIDTTCKNYQLILDTNRSVLMLIIYNIDNAKIDKEYIKHCFPQLLVLIIVDIPSHDGIENLISKNILTFYNEELKNLCINEYEGFFLYLSRQKYIISTIFAVRELLLTYRKNFS